MKNQILEPDTCLTYDILKKDEESKEANSGPKKIIIPEVVRDSRVKFFREPKLGSFVAIDLSYNSSVSKEVYKLLIFIKFCKLVSKRCNRKLHDIY